MISENQLAVGGDVEVSKLVLTNYKGKKLDISNLFIECDLYEDIFSHSLSGTITIIDTHNLIETLPIIGEETLEFTFKTPGLEKKHEISHTFSVFKLSGLTILTPHKVMYILHFTTPEVIIDQNKRISKALKGTPTTIINNILNNEIGTKKKITAESASNNIKVVPAFWNPFKCISYASSKAQTTDSFKASNFIFYETNKQYKFVSINELLKQKSTIQYKYNNDPNRNPDQKTSSRDVEAELSKVYDINIDETFNMMHRYQNGFYSHQMWEHNLLLKSVTKRMYSYTSDFTKTNHTEKYPVSSSKHITAKNHALSTITTYPQIHNEMKEDNAGKILTNKIPLMEQLNAIKIDITVNGRTDIECGDIVQLTVGGWEVLSEKDKNAMKDGNSSGRYLVVAIQHRVSIKKHSMVLRVVKESLKEAL